MPSFVASRDGVSIAFEARGAGKRALVLIHGWSCDRSYWTAQLQPLSAAFLIVTLDLAGHGDSASGRSSWSIEAFGDDVAAVVEALNLTDVVLVGHSMGGSVAVAAAQKLGERVGGIVWVDTYRKLGAPRSPEEVENLLAPFRTSFGDATRNYVRGMFPPSADPELVQRVVNDMAAAPATVAVPALESSVEYGRTITETLRGLGIPIVAINANHPPTDIPSMLEHGVEVVPMADVGHFLMMERPAEFNVLLEQVVLTRLLPGQEACCRIGRVTRGR